MRKALFGLLALIGVLGLTAQAQVSSNKKLPDLKGGIAREAKLKVATAEKLLRALGPAITEQLRAGRQVDIPGVGQFRVVRVAEYKDLVNGRPAIIPARNYIEFVPAAAMIQASNAPGAVPARTVDGYEFRVNPGSNPGQKIEGRRTIGTRTR